MTSKFDIFSSKFFQLLMISVYCFGPDNVIQPCDSLCVINSMRPWRKGHHFLDIFKWIFLNENVWLLMKLSLKFVPRGPINNILALVQIMARRRPGDKPLSEPVMDSLLTHICITPPQWVNTLSASDAVMFQWFCQYCFRQWLGACGVPYHYYRNKNRSWFTVDYIHIETSIKFELNRVIFE